MVSFVALWGNGVKITDPQEADASVVVQRPWGYEIRVDLTDGTQIFNECFVYAQMPTKTQVRDDVIAKIAQIEARIDAELNPPKNTLICQDGTHYQVPTSILPADVDLTINPTAQQIAAWNLIRPLLKTYLSSVMDVYRLAPDEYKSAFREHNQLLDQALSMVGE